MTGTVTPAAAVPHLSEHQPKPWPRKEKWLPRVGLPSGAGAMPSSAWRRAAWMDPGQPLRLSGPFGDTAPLPFPQKKLLSGSHLWFELRRAGRIPPSVSPPATAAARVSSAGLNCLRQLPGEARDVRLSLRAGSRTLGTVHLQNIPAQRVVQILVYEPICSPA